MPDKEFEGDTRFGLSTLLAGTPLGYAGYKVVRGSGSPIIRGLDTEMRPDPFSKVVAGKYRGYFKELETWVPPVAQTPDELNDMILESFRRRMGAGGMTLGIGTMEEAVAAAEAAPGVKMMLREAFGEFAGMEAGMLGTSIQELSVGAPGLARGLTVEGGAALTNVGALRAFLARPELGLAQETQAALVADLQALGELGGEMLGAKPTFQYRVIGQDKALSELLINFTRRGGGVTQFTLPIPSEGGILQRANGSLAGVRKVVGNLEAVAASIAEPVPVAPIPITGPEYAIRRLREIMARPDFYEAVPELQEEIRRLIITAETPEVAEAFAAQMAVDPGRLAEQATRIQAREALAVQGLAAGMPAGPLGKGIYYTPGAAPGGMAPPHYGQAATKPFPVRGRFAPQLFQVAPAALEEAGIQLAEEFPGVGYELAVPRADQILMAREAEAQMGGAVTRRIALDPTAPASKRFQKIMTMLQDNKTTADMLAGGSTVEETITAYLAQAGPVERQQMGAALTVAEGEVLGFTPSGAARVKTYGLDTAIKNWETIGGETIVTTEGYYTPDKVFGLGGVKHTVEYANLSAVERIGVRAKALELMRMRGEHLLEGPAYEKALARAEYQAKEMFSGSLGLIVEGKDWSTWEKTGKGQKNYSRFNQMMAARLEEKTGALPAEYYDLAPGRQRAYLETLARERGLEPGTFFDPRFMARRVEELRLGKPPGLGGIGREATFTEDAFQIFKMAGWDKISESLLARTRMDAPAMAALIQAGQAARQTAPGGITVEEMYRQGWLKPGGGIEGTIFDPRVRSQFIAETGGIVELPQEYTIQGMKVKRIAVPEFPSGHVGLYTTDEGRLIHKELDAQLRAVMEASLSDVGASATAAADLAATEPLARYFETLGGMAIAERDILGGKVIGSMKFAVGKEFIGRPGPMLAPEVAAELGLEGVAAEMPAMEISPLKFEQTLARAIEEGVLTEDLAGEMRAKFIEGRQPAVITKHPARGMGALPVYARPHPAEAEMIGYGADSTFANLTEKLHPLLTSDLDHDPLDVDFLLTRESMAEADAALQSGQVNQIIEEYKRLEQLVGDPKTERGAAETFRVFEESGLFSPEYLRKRAEREALTKRNVGLFTTRIGWPAGMSAEAGQFNFWDMFKMRFWRVNVEEAATHKIKGKLAVEADLVDQMAEAFRAGKQEKVKSLTARLFGISEEHMMQYEEEFGSVIQRMVAGWENMGTDNRQFVEAVFAGKGRGGARQFLTLQDGIISSASTAGRFVRDITGEGTRLTARAGRVFGKVFQNLAGRKRTIGLALAATAGIAALTTRPRDLTPEDVMSGKVAGGSPRQSSISSPLPQLKKNLYYRKGARPGYRVFGRTDRIADHQELARKASQVSGGLQTSVNVNDRRRMIRRDEIERAMMKDPVLGARQLESSFYNKSPLSL